MPDPRRDGSATVDTPDPLITRWSTPTANTIASDVEVKSTSDGRPRYVISTEQLDLQGDIVVQAGLAPVSDRIPAQVDHSGKMRDLIGWWSDIEVRGKPLYDLRAQAAVVAKQSLALLKGDPK